NVDTSSCNAKGITLIALIITIVIMLILAGITINLTLGENGIFQKAKLAKGQYETASVQERLELELAAIEMERQNNLTIAEYIEHLNLKNIINSDNVYKRIFRQDGETEVILEAALKIDGEVFVVYQEYGKINVYHEEGNVMMSGETYWNEEDHWIKEDMPVRNTIKTIEFVNSGVIPSNIIINEGLANESTISVTGNTIITALGCVGNPVKCWWGEYNGDVYMYVGADGGVTAPRICQQLFRNMKNLEKISFNNNFDTINSTNMGGMFENTIKLKNLELRGINTKNVIEMREMFYGMTDLESIDFGDSFDTSRVKDMRSMFDHSGGSNLEILDLSNFNTKNVEKMEQMFYYMKEVKTLKLGDNFDTSNVTSMRGMFAHMWNLTTLELGDNFDTSNVIDMNSMFAIMKKIKNLNLGQNFVTDNVNNMAFMFGEMMELENLNLGKFGLVRKNGVNSNRMFENTNGCVITVHNEGVMKWLKGIDPVLETPIFSGTINY
ncbi:MAG: BspA family leucine-rich repeat surface protein, partial [Clostridia bacterium]|nr:BspA family leucine-rich repeat surface protein [Clostridia bacterium]